MKLEERTIQSKLRYWAKQTRTAAVIAGPPADVLDEAADRLEQAQTLAEERLISIGHWKAALEETVRERDESRGQLLAFKEVRAAAQAEAAAELDCGQGTVCARPPGCRRHWEERNRELVAQLENALDASKEGSWMARALDAQRELERAQRETRMARSSANRMHDLLYEAEERCSKARGERDELKARLADRERELSLLQQAVMGATARELNASDHPLDGHVRSYREADENHVVPKVRCARNDHKFVGSKHCLRCGWEPPPGPPAPPEPPRHKPVA
jgi:hypothetical protein